MLKCKLAQIKNKVTSEIEKETNLIIGLCWYDLVLDQFIIIFIHFI
jgi:hypothetical protein